MIAIFALFVAAAGVVLAVIGLIAGDGLSMAIGSMVVSFGSLCLSAVVWVREQKGRR